MESLERPGHHFLLANTHLFFHPAADFLRLIQAIVIAKYLERLKHDLAQQVSKIGILFGGDFNSDPPSHAFTYIFTQSMPFNNLTRGLNFVSILFEKKNYTFLKFFKIQL